jgi:hypothetical protein
VSPTSYLVATAETAEVARKNWVEEEAMAQRIASKWDKFLDLPLFEEGIRG